MKGWWAWCLVGAWAAARHVRRFGGCPDAPLNLTRRGVVIAGGRPVLEAPKVCARALAFADAGYCFRSPADGGLRCLPSFVVAGAQKAATGWLRQRLARHPRLAQGGGKEIHYFDKLDRPVAASWRSRYLDEFAVDSPATYTYEKTPDYMPNATAMAALYAVVPSAQLIFLLRAPTGRAYSAFQHHCRKGRFFDAGTRGVAFSLEADARDYANAPRLAAPCRAEAFDAFLRGAGLDTRLVTWGRYADQLRAIRRVGFEDARTLVIFSETALADGVALLDFVVDWLGLARFDFGALPSFADALGRDTLREPGIVGAAKACDKNNNELGRHLRSPVSRSIRGLFGSFLNR